MESDRTADDGLIARFARGLRWAVAAVLAWWGSSGHSVALAGDPFPTIPAEHEKARALLASALRYVDPAHKLVDPVSGYPVEGWNQDPPRGLFLRSFTQLTAIGQYMELLANVAAGRVAVPGLSPDRALGDLGKLVTALRADQRDPKLAALGLLGNFLDLATGRRLGPLASNVQRTKLLAAFGPAEADRLWVALQAAGWIKPSRDGQEADIVRGAGYGYEHFRGPLAPFAAEATRQQLLGILDERVVMVVFGDNANLSASAAKTIGALLDPTARDRPGAAAIRDELEAFLDAQQAGYTRLYDRSAGLFDFGWDATHDRRFGWDDLQGKRVIGRMDYLVNEFRGPATFAAVRFGLPRDAVANLGFRLKASPTAGGDDVFALAPWEGSAFQGFGLSVMLGEGHRPAWRGLLTNLVAVETDFARSHGLPGFLSESYTGVGTQYTGNVGIPAITVSPNARITDAASLYTLGAAYSIAPKEVEAFLRANWATIAPLLTDHGPWEGFNTTRQTPIEFQTTAHTLALALGLIGQSSADMARYLASKGLAGQLDGFFRVGPGSDLLAEPAVDVFAWANSKDDKLTSGRDGRTFRVRGDAVGPFGVAVVAKDPAGLDLAGGVLTLDYRVAEPISPVTIEFKPIKPAAPGVDLIPRRIDCTLKAAPANRDRATLRVPLPATPGLAGIKEVVLYHDAPDRRPVDLTILMLQTIPSAPTD